MAQELQHGVVVAAHIEDAHGLVVVAELPPSPDFEQLFERADPAGNRQESLGAVGHQRLAFVHGVDDVQLVAQQIGVFLVDQRMGNHTDHAPAGLLSGLRDDTHHAALAAAIHQLAAVLADPVADFTGGVEVQLADAGARTAIDTERKAGGSGGIGLFA